jgi:hypothetical protein
VPRKKSPEFGKDNWKALTTWLSMVHDLDDAKFRESVAMLADAVEREGHAAHRSADTLDGLSTFTIIARNAKPANHARSAIASRLRRWYGQDRRQPRIAEGRVTEGRLDQLVEVGSRAQLRQQAAILLDAAELIRSWLEWHKQRLEKLWPSKKGRTPSVAKHEVLLKMVEWEVGPTEMSERLHEAGIRSKGFKPRPLTSDLSRYRAESRKKKK